MQYYVDVLASGAVVGPGPLTEITEWTVTKRIDRAGSFSFTMPASADAAELVQIKRSCNIYARLSSGYTYVGGGIIDSVERTIAADGTVVLKVAGDDNLRELTTRTVKDLQLFTTTAYGTWTGTALGSASDVPGLIVLSNGRILAGTGSTWGKVYSSDDGGLTWTDRGQLGSATYVHSFTEYTGGQVIATTANNGKVYASTDYGSTWTEYATAGSAAALYDSGMASAGYLLISGLNPNYAEAKTVTVWETTNLGDGLTEFGSETGIAQPYPQNVNCIANGGGGLLGTADGKIWSRGASVWEYEAAPVSTSYAINDLAYLSAGVWWAATNYGGRIYVSSSVSSWSQLAQLSGRTSVTALCRTSATSAWAGADGHIYRSTNDGSSWTALLDLGSAIRRIVELTDGTVLASCADGKVYRSSTLVAPLSHADAVADLEDLAPAGWTFTPDATPGNNEILIQFGGESVLAAALLLAQRSGTHCYLSASKTLTFIDTWSSSGVHLVELDGGAVPDATVGAIVGLTKTEQSYDVVTRIYPYGRDANGARLGIASKTISDPTGTTVSAANNYVQHDAGYAAYGLIERWIDYDDVQAGDEDNADAADALILAAANDLTKLAEVRTNYNITIGGLSVLLSPMTTVPVWWRGDGLSINATLNILEATWRGDASGMTTASIVAAPSPYWIEDDAEIVSASMTRVARLAAR